MKKKLIFAAIVGLLILSLIGCSETETSDSPTLNNPVVAMDALIEIGDLLYYDASTGIVYLWNGFKMANNATTPSPYYAPNGLPYKYNPETNTLYEITFDFEEVKE